jgi:hypothetical protein
MKGLHIGCGRTVFGELCGVVELLSVMRLNLPPTAFRAIKNIFLPLQKQNKQTI